MFDATGTGIFASEAHRSTNADDLTQRVDRTSKLIEESQLLRRVADALRDEAERLRQQSRVIRVR